MSIYAINLTSMNSADTKKLFEFLSHENPNTKLWTANHVYKYKGDNITLSHDLVWRKRNGDKKGNRYEAISNQIGQGGMGVVYNIAGTVAIDNSNLIFKQGKSRVVKVQQHRSDNTVDSINNEYLITQKASHMAVKKPTVIQNKSYTVMKKLPGKELYDIIEDDLGGLHVLSTKQRVDLTKALLKALKEQVSDKGILHRDIKPENIRVDLKEPITVNIFDFGLSTLIAKPDSRRPGTPNYAAPEAYKRGASFSPKSDVFSMARVLGLLWRDETSRYTYSVQQAADYSTRVNYDLLFRGIPDSELSAVDKKIVRDVLVNMSNKDPVNRLSIEEAILAFDKLHPNKSLPTKPAAGNSKLPVDNKTVELNLKNILDNIAQLRLKANDFHKKDEWQLSANLFKVANKLELETLNFMKLDENGRKKEIVNYTASCKEQIDGIKPSLEKHLDARCILANIGLAIAGLGFIYLIAISINKAVNGNFLFFSKPKSVEYAEKIEASIDTIDKQVRVA